MSLEQIAANRCFEGVQQRFSHESHSLPYQRVFFSSVNFGWPKCVCAVVIISKMLDGEHSVKKLPSTVKK